MKLTKKLETEILKVYKTYWDSYNNGDIKTFAGTLDKTFELIGTSESEICHTREDGIRFIKAQVKELVGKVEMRNRKISLVPVNELMLVNEQCDIYFLNGRDWSFYSKIRISTFLRKTTSGWKVFQQHGSLPDMRVQEGETLAVKKISKENLQLKEAIKRRTVELEQKNRELEVETALEKVRAVALGMKKAEDMLSICKTISQQLAKLGVKEIRNVQTAIFNVPAGTYMNYEFYAKHDKTFITETLYTNHKVARAFAAKMLKGKGEVSITHIKGKEKVKEWLNYQKGTNVFIDTYLNKATSLTYYWFSLGPVALGISTYLPLTKEELQLFQRFLNVFELAYRRYLDIEKASAQAKEAEIQLALERVRARTMAMQKSEELGETSFLLFQQFKGLGVTSDQISIGIFKEDENSMELYSTLYGSQWKEAATVDLDEPVVINKIYAAWKKQKKSLVIDLTGNDLRKYNRYRKKLSNINYKEKRWVIHIAFFSKGMLTFSATKPHPQETMQLLERFTGVFDLTYTRFLDLQKAEAQAREAQIEAALERIRARALAMHSSDEFTDVARVMREQMGQLGQQELETSAVHLYDEDAEYILSWRAFRLSSDLKSKINYGFFKIPKNSCKIAREFVQKFKSKATDYTIEISGVMQTEWYKILFKLAPEVQAAMKKSGTTKEKRYYHFSKFSGGSLLMVSSKEPSNDAIELQKRAAQVFDLAYRRFKDLQKAEAQAREAQIQLALERVRARTMAMHHSDELTNVVKLLYQEFDKLKISNESTDIEIGLIDEDTGLAKIWAHLYLSDGSISTFNFPFAHFDSLNDEFKKWRSTPVEKRNELFITTEFSGKLWNKFKKLAREVPELAGMFESLIAGNIKKWVTHNAYFSHGLLTLQGTEHYSQEIQEILKRFAKVFEQTYTRFLDLQKAEAQAREAQVEAALEKVRSRSLAMHKSDELEEVIMVVSEQLQQLKFRFHNVSFGINNERRDFNFWMASPGVAHPFLLAVPYIDNPAITHPLKARSKGVDFISDILSFEENKAWLQHLFEYSVLKNVSEDHKNFLLATKRFARSQVLNKHTILTIGNYAGVPYTDEQNDILKRFGNVFEQAYTRFLDLQKAEAQAREAQIEAALERVRSRSMAMHKSEELKEVIKVVLEQFVHLNINVGHSGFYIDYKAHDDMHIWLADPNIEPFYAVIPYFDTPTWNSFLEAKAKGTTLHTDLLDFKEKNKFYRSLFKLFEVPEEAKKFYLECKGLAVSTVLLDNVGLYIENFEGIPYSDEENAILMRFGKVFQQTYTRFLDLQKAEAQAREAQIEAALERIRGKVTSMQESSELLDIVVSMRHEFVSLGHEAGYFWYMRWLPEKYEKAMTSGDGTRIGMVMTLPRHIHGDIQLVAEWEKSDEPSLVFPMDVDTAVEYVDKMITLGDFQQVDPQAPTLDDIRHIGGLTFVMARTTHGEIGYSLAGAVPNPPAEDVNTLIRFAAVFDLAYKRFEDLKESEKRNRETQIELALERVRSRTMAMHKSDELLESGEILFSEMQKLGIESLTAGYVLMDKDEKNGLNYTPDPFTKKILPLPVIIPHDETDHMRQVVNHWKKGSDFYVIEMDEEETIRHQTFIAERSTNFTLNAEQLIAISPARLFLHNFYFKEGYILIVGGTKLSAEQTAIMLRFAKVFQQTYTRFLDLQKAEVQAREAQIEAALERVRARAMAMHSTTELKEVVHELRKQMGILGQKKLETCVIHLHDESEDFIQSWAAINPPDTQDEILETIVNVPKKGLLIIEEALSAYSANRQEYVIINEGEKQKQWFIFLEKESPDGFAKLSAAVQGNIEQLRAFWSFADFAGGSLLMVTLEVPDEPTRGLLRRFSNVFGLAYRRFADLKQAEAQAREAQIEAALERVRSRTLAMQKSDELAETAAVLFQQLIVLGIAPNRLFIIIIKEDTPDMEAWLTDEDGSKVSMGFTGNYLKNTSLLKMYEGWEAKRKTLVIDMQGEELQQYFHYLHDELNVPFKGGLEQKRRVQHLAYFSHGMIGMASPDPQPNETLELLERFAAVFNLTFTRFNDLQIAEAHARQAELDLIAIKEAKQKAEEALTELQATQKQLIQSEKMASLGELTAGIAHEIQNPLNFVNNFSEVSKELLDEMKEAIEKGDADEAKEIMNDVIQNLEKINHHGKRADGIVKGMLQHSRSGSNTKEPTDVNALCDEYLRLAYHGLRAKDKSFNAKFESHFDVTVGKIEVMPQDMGRVVLNLINNAFYAVSERKKAGEAGYEPTVVVSTKKENGNVIISVRDNGTGIPQKVLDKIFQPFFTTKPTGQGTGLGLSLSYDIIKAHGGELKVETEDGEGSTFIITLPA